MGEWDSIAGLAGMLGDRKEGFEAFLFRNKRTMCCCHIFMWLPNVF